MISQRAAPPSPSEIAIYLESLGVTSCPDLIRMGAPAYSPRRGDTPQTVLADYQRNHGAERIPAYYAVYRDLILLEAIS